MRPAMIHLMSFIKTSISQGLPAQLGNSADAKRTQRTVLLQVQGSPLAPRKHECSVGLPQLKSSICSSQVVQQGLFVRSPVICFTCMSQGLQARSTLSHLFEQLHCQRAGSPAAR